MVSLNKRCPSCGSVISTCKQQLLGKQAVICSECNIEFNQSILPALYLIFVLLLFGPEGVKNSVSMIVHLFGYLVFVLSYLVLGYSIDFNLRKNTNNKFDLSHFYIRPAVLIPITFLVYLGYLILVA